MITKRDRTVIEWLEKFGVAKTDTIAEIFYPNIKVARRRLKAIYDANLLKREREHFTSQYYYYTKKPQQLYHKILLTDFYKDLNKKVNIKLFENEYVCEDIRADGLVAYEINNETYIAFVEIQISNQPLDIAKYDRLYRSGKYKLHFKTNNFPLVIAITNKNNIPKTNFKIIRINEDMSNLDVRKLY